MRNLAAPPKVPGRAARRRVPRAGSLSSNLVVEQPQAREAHGHAVAVRRPPRRVVVADGAAGLLHVSHAGAVRALDICRQGEEEGVRPASRPSAGRSHARRFSSAPRTSGLLGKDALPGAVGGLSSLTRRSREVRWRCHDHRRGCRQQSAGQVPWGGSAATRCRPCCRRKARAVNAALLAGFPTPMAWPSFVTRKVGLRVPVMRL